MEKIIMAVGETTILGRENKVLVWRRSADEWYAYDARGAWSTMTAVTPFPRGVSRDGWRSFARQSGVPCLTELCSLLNTELPECFALPLISSLYSSDSMYRGMGSYHEHHGRHLNAPTCDKSPRYMFGVELETEFMSQYARRGFFSCFRSNWVYAERDGSLSDSCGAEFITVPLCPSDAKSVRFWRPFCEMLTTCRARSFSSSRTGLHVHVSRTILGTTSVEQDETIGRLLYLYFYVQGDELRRRVFGRSYGHYNTQLTSEVANATKVLPEALHVSDVSKRVSDSLKSSAECNRYYSVNLTNAATIEFRDGKGSISAERISAIVEYCELLCLYARTHRIHEMSEEGFVSYAKSKMRSDSALYNYINEQ